MSNPNFGLYADLSLRGLALVELMSDREAMKNPRKWVDTAMALGETPEEIMELLVGMNHVVGLLLQMVAQVTGHDEKQIVEALRASIIMVGTGEFDL